MARRALLVINRHSRQGRGALGPVADALAAEGVVAMERACASAGELSPLIAAEARDLDMVVLGGGDGTLNAALEGLVAAGRPLALIPLGTANDLARTLGLPADPGQAAAAAARGVPKSIDLGSANGKLFANVASVGLSVDITRGLDSRVKRRWGRLGYGLQAMRTLRQRQPFRARIRIDGRNLQVEALQVAVGNGEHFGGGMRVADDASIDDGLLDLFTVPPGGPLDMLALLRRLPLGRHGRLDRVHTERGRTVELVTAWPMPVDTDGEITTRTPARFKVHPRVLTVLVPREANR